MEPTLCSDKFN